MLGIVRTEALNGLNKLVISVEKVWLRNEARYAAIASANVEHSVSQTARRIAEAVALRILARVMEDVTRQMEVEGVQTVQHVVFQINHFIRSE